VVVLCNPESKLFLVIFQVHHFRSPECRKVLELQAAHRLGVGIPREEVSGSVELDAPDNQLDAARVPLII
jgi:hypothetical protein